MSYWRLFYHLIWATRGREPLITPELETKVRRQVTQAAERSGVLVHAVGGTTDHVHLAVSIPPTLAVADAVRRIKGASSRAINEQTGGFGWQPEYGVVSFAERHLPNVVAYVQNQADHHADRRLWPALEQTQR